MSLIGPATLGTGRASPEKSVAIFVLSSFLFLGGCQTAGGGKVSGRSHGSAKALGPKVCEVQVGLLKKAVRGTQWYRTARLRLKTARKRAQDILDGMTARYRKRYDLDIRAAMHLKKERELERLRGAVISEEEYRNRRGKLAAVLDADPGLKRAVDEQRSDSMAYRVRKQNALMEATKIALAGRRLEKRLAEAAGELDEHLHDVLRAAVRSVAAHALAERRCDLVCAGAVVVGARRPRRGSCKMRASLDLTGDVAAFAVRSLGGKSTTAGRSGKTRDGKAASAKGQEHRSGEPSSRGRGGEGK